MASYWTNKGKADLAIGGVQVGTRQFRLMLVTSAPASGAVAADLNFPADVTGVECTFTNYARKDITMGTPTEDDTGDKANIIATSPTTYTAAGGATNNTIVGAYLFRRGTGGTDTPASDPLWVYLGLASPIATNGGDVTISFNAAGISTLT